MNNLFSSINKFNTLENFFIFNFSENPILESIKKGSFLQPAPEFRRFMILEHISKKNKISQAELAKKVKIVPAMVNKYLKDFRKENIISATGKNHKHIIYNLTKKGENLKKKYLYEFVKEILIIYKDIKNEVKINIRRILSENLNKKILLYGANEIAELIIQCNDELNLNIVGIIDSDENKINKKINDIIILSPNKIDEFDFDLILITSITNRNVIYNKIKYIETKNKKVYMYAD